MQQASMAQRLGLKLLVVLAYATLFFFLIPQTWLLIWFVVGVLCGVGFLLADDFYLSSFYQEPAQSKKFLVSHSPLFLITLVPLALFVFTSSGSSWASGVVGGMMLFLLLEMTELRQQPVVFNQKFLADSQKNLSTNNVQLILVIGWLVFVMLHLLSMVR